MPKGFLAPRKMRRAKRLNPEIEVGICPPMITPFVLDTSGNAAYHAGRVLILEKLLYSQEFSDVEFRITGLGGLHPSVALTYLDAIDHGPAKQSARVVSYAHLLGGGDLALFLGCAPIREIRASATIWVPDYSIVSDCRWCYAPGVDPTVRLFVGENDNKRCLARIAHHVELDLILDRQLTRTDLVELLLVGATPALDAALSPPRQFNAADGAKAQAMLCPDQEAR